MSVKIKYVGENYNPDFGSYFFHASNSHPSIKELCEATIKNAHPELVKRAEQIIASNKVHDVEASFGEMLLRPKDQTGKHSIISFKAIVDGSNGEHYHVTIQVIREEGSFNYGCECPYYFKESRKQVCKHVLALFIWIRDNYVFDPNNYTLEVMKKNVERNVPISLYDGEVSIKEATNINGLREIFSTDVLDKIMMFEKACRFLEIGVRSYNEDKTLWSDKRVRELFINQNINFDYFMNSLLGNSYKINQFSRGTRDDDFIRFDKRNENPKNLVFDTFSDRITNIKHSVVYKPKEMSSISEFCRVFDTFENVTKFKAGTHLFTGKYILFPNYVEILMVNADEVPMLFFEKFKLGNQTFKDGFFIKNKDKNILVIYNWLRGFRPSFD